MRTGNDLIVGGELILSGDVLLDDYAGWMFEEDVFFTPRMVRDALAALGEGRVTVRLNSNGGHTDAGEQIRATLAAHPGGCRIVVEGIAASAASLIFMAGAERLMTRGSHLMIHDPSGGIFGNEDETRKQADMLGLIADTYAAVYAAASGKTPEEARAIMRAVTWYGPEEAVAQGFADGVVEEDDASAVPPPPVAAAVAAGGPVSVSSLEAAKAAFMSAGSHLRDRLRNAHAGRDPAAGAPGKDKDMKKDTPTQTPAAPAPSPAPTDMTAGDRQSLLETERARMRGIREMAQPFVVSGRLMQADIDALIDDGTPVAEAGAKLMAKMAVGEQGGQSMRPGMRAGAGGGVRIERDETDTRLEGMIGALMHKKDGPAEMYRGLRIKRLAMELSGPQRGYDEASAIRRGMTATTMTGGALGVSDFAYITTEVMRRSLLAEYTRRAPVWQAVTGAPLTASDFREIYAVRFGGDFALKDIGENGEYREATLSDEAEGLKVTRRGRTITLSFEAIVNDDMGAFNRIPNNFAMAARQMESSMVWALFRDNAKLKSDSKALFHADHKNLAGTPGAISPDTVGAGRAAMWQQLMNGGADKDDFAYVEANRLIVPPALEVDALRFVSDTVPAKDSDVNPLKSLLTPIVVPNLSEVAGGSDSAWYLVSSDLPPIQHAYLEGYEAPTVQTTDGMNPDAVKMTARHIFGAAAVEYRGAYKNAGV